MYFILLYHILVLLSQHGLKFWMPGKNQPVKS